MSTPGDTVSERTISTFPLSVGTSLALESIFTGKLEPVDPDRVIDQIDINRYTEIWINVSTLFRNLVSACSKIAFKSTNVNELLSVLQMEIDVINDIFATEGQGFCRPIYYTNSYEELRRYGLKHNIKFRDPTTPQQIHYQLTHDKVLKELDKLTDSTLSFQGRLKPALNSKALIVTHVPYDLLSHKEFSRLHLLESHTGVLKGRELWGSKLYPYADKSLTHIPFNKTTLMVFGDKVQIHPSPMKLRDLIYDISIKRKWNALTTLPKMDQDFTLDIKEPYVLAWLKALE